MTYKRKTYDEYQIHQYYPYTKKWEEISTYQNIYSANIDLKLYRINQPDFPARIVKKRIKISEN